MRIRRELRSGVRFLVCVWLVQVAACGAGRGGPHEPVFSHAAHHEEPPSGEHPLVEHDEMWSGLEAPEPGWSACTAGAECTTVEVGCCDHCNGGRLVAVRAEHAEAVRAHATSACDEVACTERGCDGGEPRCVAGRCAFVALYRSAAP